MAIRSNPIPTLAHHHISKEKRENTKNQQRTTQAKITTAAEIKEVATRHPSSLVMLCDSRRGGEGGVHDGYDNTVKLIEYILHKVQLKY
jgi:hypothetical protein